MIKSFEYDPSVYCVRRLRENEIVESFNCGDEDLNDFLLNRAKEYHNTMLVVTYVYEHINNGKVIAYFSLANDRISIDDFNNNTEFNRFRRNRFVNEKRLRNYPAVKICRLGIDNSVHGNGIGSMLIDFIKSYYNKENNKAGCRFITVDAYNNAIPFYEKNKFQHLSSERYNNVSTRLLYYDLNETIKG